AGVSGPSRVSRGEAPDPAASPTRDAVQTAWSSGQRRGPRLAMVADRRPVPGSPQNTGQLAQQYLRAAAERRVVKLHRSQLRALWHVEHQDAVHAVPRVDLVQKRF